LQPFFCASTGRQRQGAEEVPVPHKRLWRYAYKLTGDSEAARDVTQDAKGDGTNVIDIDIEHIDCLNLTFRAAEVAVAMCWATGPMLGYRGRSCLTLAKALSHYPITDSADIFETSKITFVWYNEFHKKT